MTGTTRFRFCGAPNGLPLIRTAWVLLFIWPMIGCHPLNFIRHKEKLPDEKASREKGEANLVGLPSRHTIRIAPFIFLSDFEIPRDQPLFTELADLRDQIHKELLLPPTSAEVRVYLFETRERYDKYMKERYPDLPERRAFFVAQPRTMGGAEDLLVFTYWGKRIRQDLRHELTHALLHSVIKDVPLWLDEGLAEYFELPPDLHGLNSGHVEILQRGIVSGAYKLDLARLERLKQVDEMNPSEYREAWAWVHLLLNSTPEARTMLLSYLQQLRGSRHPGMLVIKVEKLFPDAEKALTKHLQELDSRQAQGKKE